MPERCRRPARHTDSNDTGRELGRGAAGRYGAPGTPPRPPVNILSMQTLSYAAHAPPPLPPLPRCLPGWGRRWGAPGRRRRGRRWVRPGRGWRARRGRGGGGRGPGRPARGGPRAGGSAPLQGGAGRGAGQGSGAVGRAGQRGRAGQHGVGGRSAGHASRQAGSVDRTCVAAAPRSRLRGEPHASRCCTEVRPPCLPCFPTADGRQANAPAGVAQGKTRVGSRRPSTLPPM